MGCAKSMLVGIIHKIDFISLKAIYFCVWGALGALSPYLPTFLNVLGVESAPIGIISSFQSFLTTFGAPIWALLADTKHWHKYVLVYNLIVSTLLQMSLLFVGRSVYVLGAIIFVQSAIRTPIAPLIDAGVMSSLPSPDMYGKQRLYGAISYGLFVLFSGIIATLPTANTTTHSDSSNTSSSSSNSSQSEEGGDGDVSPFYGIFFLYGVMSALSVLSIVYATEKSKSLRFDHVSIISTSTSVSGHDGDEPDGPIAGQTNKEKGESIGSDSDGGVIVVVVGGGGAGGAVEMVEMSCPASSSSPKDGSTSRSSSGARHRSGHGGAAAADNPYNIPTIIQSYEPVVTKPSASIDITGSIESGTTEITHREQKHLNIFRDKRAKYQPISNEHISPAIENAITATDRESHNHSNSHSHSNSGSDSPNDKDKDMDGSRSGSGAGSGSGRLCRVDVLLFFLVLYVSGLCSGIIDTFLFVRLKDIGGSFLVMGVARAITCAAEIPVFQQFDWLVRHLGLFGMILLAELAYTVRFVAYSLIREPWLVLPVEVLHGFTFAALWSASCSYAHDIAPKSRAAFYQSLVESIHWGIGQGSGALLGGYLYSKPGVGPVKMFQLFAVVSTANALLVLSIMAHKQRKSNAVHSADKAAAKTAAAVAAAAGGGVGGGEVGGVGEAEKTSHSPTADKAERVRAYRGGRAGGGAGRGGGGGVGIGARIGRLRRWARGWVILLYAITGRRSTSRMKPTPSEYNLRRSGNDDNDDNDDDGGGGVYEESFDFAIGGVACVDSVDNIESEVANAYEDTGSPSLV